MRTHSHRPGLSFELAPPRRPHPNRTDIACFVGCVARRAQPRVRGPMPEALARWLESQPALTPLVGRDAQTLRRAVVDLRSARDFEESLEAALGPGIWPDVVDLAALERLLQACRDLSPAPPAVLETLRAAGFSPGGLLGRPDAGSLPEQRSRAELDGWTRLQRLVNLPVRCESFDAFAALFAWERRPVESNASAPDDPVVATPLGAAVRAFFAAGGRTCYVVATGEPTPLFAPALARYGVLRDPRSKSTTLDLAPRVPILPGAPENREAGDPPASDELHGAAAPAPAPVAPDPTGWCGVEHVFGLDDVSFVVVPDLVDAIAAPIPPLVPPEPVLALEERFAECVERPVQVPPPIGRRLPPPRLDDRGLLAWKTLVAFARALLDNGARAFNRRDAQLLASLPLVEDTTGSPKQADWAAWLAADPRLHSDRVQLAWPWLRTRESGDCQGGVEAPEGTLAGVLSGSALDLGSYRSAARRPVHRLVGIEPQLNLGQALGDATVTSIGELTLADRVCLIAPSPRGPELVSDVTLAGDPARRAGAVRRLVNVVIAEARAIGADVVFDANGEALWDALVSSLEDLGRLLLEAGALSTDAGDDAFTARCGRTTMTQADIDAGRVIVEIALVPAQPTVRIVVVLDLRDAAFADAGAAAARAA